MRTRAQQLLGELEELERRMATGDVRDPQERARVGKRMKELERLREITTAYDRCQRQLSELDRVRASGERELLTLAQEEAAQARVALPELEAQMRRFLLPRDPDDDRAVILEIRAGTGGEEAALFAGELLRMYVRFSESRGWTTEVLSTSVSDLRGVKEAICRVSGVGAYGSLKFESGVHRIQRIPSTEAKGRVHTSTATVAVLPEAEEIDIPIASQDLRIDTFMSSGPGGQSVNTTYSAVRVTHLPTGTVVSCQDEKSQQKNKQKALSVLRSRLYAAERERRSRERGEMRSGQIGTGERAEKIRTYNVPQDRLTDHRLDRNFSSLPSRFEGEIGDIVDALREWEAQQRLRKA